jgi:transcriptional regulator with XRE-family HTH domain
MSSYGEKLRRAREAQGLSQEKLAKRMGLQRQANLPLYENDRKLPDATTIVRHAAGLKMKPSELLRDVIFVYDRIRAGEYDDRTVQSLADKQRGEESVPTKKRRQAGTR